MTERRTNVNGLPFGTITWREHAQAWIPYGARYGNRQDAERIAERGGFGWSELTEYLGHEPKTWEPDERTPKNPDFWERVRRG